MEKIKHKFNALDLVIIAAVAVAVISLVKIYIVDGYVTEKTEGVSLQYVIQTDILSEELAGNVTVGDAVYDSETGRRIGEVSACDIRGATYEGVSENGSRVVSDIAGYKRLHVTVKTEAEGGAKGYSANSVPISVGKSYRIMLPNLYVGGSCISVEVIG